MKKFLFAAALVLAAPLALAGNGNGNNGNGNGNGGNNGSVGGVVVVGGALHGYAGYAAGEASSVSNGSAIAATSVAGTGASFQHTEGVSGGSATIGGAVTPVGAAVVTGTTQYASVASYGVTIGQPAVNGDGLIVNGTTGFASSENVAQGDAAFATGGIGAIGVIGGVAGWFSN